MTKVCSDCGEEKSRDQFWANSKSRDGLCHNCIPCRNLKYKGKVYKGNDNKCEECEVPISAYATYCGRCGHLGNKSGRYKSGREKDPKGYVILTGMQWHPNARKGGQIPEHRYVMTQILGRPLLPGETVHHKNGIRDDNRPENLELWCKSQPDGQRVEDKVEWAIQMLELYRPEVLNRDHLTT